MLSHERVPPALMVRECVEGKRDQHIYSGCEMEISDVIKRCLIF